MFKDYHGYKVSEDGIIIGKRLNREMKFRIDMNGYKSVGLIINGKKKSIRLHRLLGLLFIENPLNKPTVDHINRDKLDNRLCNLRWASKLEQVKNRNKYRIKNRKGSIRKIRNKYYFRYWEEKLIEESYNTYEECIERQKNYIEQKK